MKNIITIMFIIMLSVNCKISNDYLSENIIANTNTINKTKGRYDYLSSNIPSTIDNSIKNSFQMGWFVRNNEYYVSPEYTKHIISYEGGNNINSTTLFAAYNMGVSISTIPTMLKDLSKPAEERNAVTEYLSTSVKNQEQNYIAMLADEPDAGVFFEEYKKDTKIAFESANPGMTYDFYSDIDTQNKYYNILDSRLKGVFDYNSQYQTTVPIKFNFSGAIDEKSRDEVMSNRCPRPPINSSNKLSPSKIRRFCAEYADHLSVDNYSIYAIPENKIDDTRYIPTLSVISPIESLFYYNLKIRDIFIDKGIDKTMGIIIQAPADGKTIDGTDFQLRAPTSYELRSLVFGSWLVGADDITFYYRPFYEDLNDGQKVAYTKVATDLLKTDYIVGEKPYKPGRSDTFPKDFNVNITDIDTGLYNELRYCISVIQNVQNKSDNYDVPSYSNGLIYPLDEHIGGKRYMRAPYTNGLHNTLADRFCKFAVHKYISLPNGAFLGNFTKGSRGLPDIIYWSESQAGWVVVPELGRGSNPIIFGRIDQGVNARGYYENANINKKHHFQYIADFNGDGRDDLIYWGHYVETDNSAGWRVLMTNSTGTGWSDDIFFGRMSNEYNKRGYYEGELDDSFILTGHFTSSDKSDLMYWGEGGWRVLKTNSTSNGWENETLFGRIDIDYGRRGYSEMDNPGGYHVITDYDGNGADDLLYFANESSLWRIMLSDAGGWRSEVSVGDDYNW